MNNQTPGAHNEIASAKFNAETIKVIYFKSKNLIPHPSGEGMKVK
jgi:hypothetical protein